MRCYLIVLTSPLRPVSIVVPVGGARKMPNTSAGSVGDRVDPSARLPDVRETSSWRFSYDNEAVRVTAQQRAVENEGLKGKLVAAETEKVAVQNDLDSMKEKHRREIEGHDAATHKECNLARRSLAREYDAVLAVAGFSGVATRIVRQESGWGQRLGSRG
ncbi:hypothetical protein HID58_048232 [Brassica napus]|uniref:Uncharacterized protein n=1 Tax=Brassica napus TaxID=3708 RepID=A0ABQ8B1K6_BRANA|nr:hypothetical protein HID58_048232 [Brassica napus]